MARSLCCFIFQEDRVALATTVYLQVLTTFDRTGDRTFVKDILAYLHPALQAFAIVVAMATLRLGLILKKDRSGRRRLRNRRTIYQRHTLLGLVALGCLSGGYGLGLLSMPLLRDRAPFRSAHFFFATIALLLLLGGAYTGWRLKQGTPKYADVRDIHGFLVYLGLFISLGVAVMGFILLP